MQFLQSLQRQVSGFQNSIRLLNSFSELNCPIFWGTISYIFGPKYHTDFTFSLLKGLGLEPKLL